MMNDQMYCQGCGVQLQSEDENKTGYIPQSSLNREYVLCKRCYRLKHYNETEEVSISDDDFLKMVSQIGKEKGLVVHLIDVFDVDGSMISSLSRIVGNNPIVLVGNKIDLLPKSLNKQKLNHWLRSRAKEAGLKIVDVFLISAEKGYGMKSLLEHVDHYRENKDVYIVGTTNVGKSTFINRIISQSTGIKDVITTSYFPGTTLGFIEVPLDDHTYLIDTPGIVNKKQMAHYVSDEDLKLIIPKKEVKARVYQLNDEQTLFFGGLARIDFIKGTRQSFICYFSNDVPIHRTKLEKADELYKNHVGELLSPPNTKTLENYPELITHTFKTTEDRTDIVFSGLGFLTILEKNTVVIVHHPKEVAVSMRKSLI